MPQLLALSLFLVWTHIWVFQGVGSVSQYVYCTKFKVIIGHTLFQLVYDIFLLMPIEYLLPMSNSHLDRNFFPTFIQNCQMIKLEHLDETWQEVANKISIKKWNTLKSSKNGDLAHIKYNIIFPIILCYLSMSASFDAPPSSWLDSWWV
jgi:hypothetical protein